MFVTDLHKFIDTWDGEHLFIYLAIGLIVIWFFSKQNIGLNIMFGCMVAVIIISYLNNRTIVAADSYDQNMKKKRSVIVPRLEADTANRNDMVNFIFSVQDIRPYNPQQYDVMIHNINKFFSLYDVVTDDPSTCTINYELMAECKKNATNALMSMIFKVPSDQAVIDKINDAARVLDDLMNKYLDQISYVIDNYIYTHGYDTNTRIIDYGPKAFNEYNDMMLPYSYEIF